MNVDAPLPADLRAALIERLAQLVVKDLAEHPELPEDRDDRDTMIEAKA